MRDLTLAVSQYSIEDLADWNAYVAKITSLVQSAKKQQAQLLLLPEYSGVELAGLKLKNFSQGSHFSNIQLLLNDYIQLYSQLARDYQICIQAGTIPVQATATTFYNRAYLFGINGKYDFQDKMNLTKFEIQSGILERGTTNKIFNTHLGKLGISICYDSEFPVLIQQQIIKGAQLILVPSCTDTIKGYNRVRLCCRARAVENQCFIVQSCLVGTSPLSEFIDVNVGKSAIFSPADLGFPDSGIIVQGKWNQAELVTGTISFTDLEYVRNNGQVNNFNDMKLAEYKKVEIIALES